MQFPAITICPSQSVHCGHLHKRILECQESDTNCSRRTLALLCQIDALGECGKVLQAINSHIMVFGSFHLAQCPPVNLSALVNQVDFATKLEVYETNFLSWLDELADAERIRIAPQYEDMIMDCSFKQSRIAAHCQQFLESPERMVNRFGVCFSGNYFPPSGDQSLSEVLISLGNMMAREKKPIFVCF